MASMTRTVLMYIIGPIIFAVIVFGALRIFNPAHSYTRTIVSDVVQGVLVGAGLSFITILLILPKQQRNTAFRPPTFGPVPEQ